jgi:hypothetical protein
VAVTARGERVERPLIVRPGGNGILVTDDRLSTAVAAFGGVTVEADGIAALVTRLRASATPRHTPVPVHPMRSAWWIVPFAACLGGEWWLRRRAPRS